jgi:hypothetical protein
MADRMPKIAARTSPVRIEMVGSHRHERHLVATLDRAMTDHFRRLVVLVEAGRRRRIA